MILTARQRTKINVGLCLIHDKGHDAKQLVQRANDLVRRGQNVRSAYEQTLNSFFDKQPALSRVASKLLNLVDASDDTTVDQYDVALSTYLTTGDDRSLTALTPTITQDSIALALKNGEITPEEAATGDVSKVLSFEAASAVRQAAACTAQRGITEQSAVPQIGDALAPKSFGNSSQVSLGGRTGIVAPRAAQAWARDVVAREIVRGETEAAQSL